MKNLKPIKATMTGIEKNSYRFNCKDWNKLILHESCLEGSSIGNPLDKEELNYWLSYYLSVAYQGIYSEVIVY